MPGHMGGGGLGEDALDSFGKGKHLNIRTSRGISRIRSMNGKDRIQERTIIMQKV